MKQPGFTYSAFGPFTINKEKIQRFKKTGDSRYIYKNELDKVCFRHDMAYGDFKDLAKRTASYKVLSDKALAIANNPKYDGDQRGLTSMVYKFFDKKSPSLADKSASGGAIKSMQNQQLANELYKPILRKFKKKKSILII